MSKFITTKIAYDKLNKLRTDKIFEKTVYIGDKVYSFKDFLCGLSLRMIDPRYEDISYIIYKDFMIEDIQFIPYISDIGECTMPIIFKIAGVNHSDFKDGHIFIGEETIPQEEYIPLFDEYMEEYWKDEIFMDLITTLEKIDNELPMNVGGTIAIIDGCRNRIKDIIKDFQGQSKINQIKDLIINRIEKEEE